MHGFVVSARLDHVVFREQQVRCVITTCGMLPVILYGQYVTPGFSGDDIERERAVIIVDQLTAGWLCWPVTASCQLTYTATSR